MTFVELDDVSIDFQIYNTQTRSLKRTLLSFSSGGFIKNDQNGVVIQALRNVSLCFKEGDRVGLIGGNGAGKTTLLRALAGIFEPTSGKYRRNGRVSTLFDTMLGMDPDSTGYENIKIRGLLMGLSRSEVERKVEEIVEFSELQDYLYMPLRTYSSGMVLRLAFSTITCVIPEILLMDEWLSVGDASFIGKAERKLREVVGKAGVLVMASHSMDTLKKTCRTAVVLKQGVVVHHGPIDDCIEFYESNAGGADNLVRETVPSKPASA